MDCGLERIVRQSAFSAPPCVTFSHQVALDHLKSFAEPKLDESLSQLTK